MNWIAEMKAFKRWTDTNYLPPNAQLLWFKLMIHNNSCMWAEWFAVDNLRLMVMIGVNSEKTAIAARDKLLEAGLIEYRKGKKGCPGKYHMVSLCCKFYSEFDSVSYSANDSENAGYLTVQSTAINKHKRKPKTLTLSCDDGDDSAGARENAVSEKVESFVENLFKRYIGRAPVDGERESCLALIQVHGRALMESAFNEACRHDQRNMAYVCGVLRRFSERGIRTEEDEAAFDLARR